MVEAIFAEEEGFCVARVLGAATREHHHVAACAKAAAGRVVDEHCLHLRVAAPLEQGRAHRVAHLSRERMDRLWAVEAQPADVALDGNQDVAGHCRSISRLTITRMI